MAQLSVFLNKQCLEWGRKNRIDILKIKCSKKESAPNFLKVFKEDRDRSVAWFSLIQDNLRLDQTKIEENIVEKQLCGDQLSRISCIEFANYLNIPKDDPNLLHLFKLYDKNVTGYIDFREYLHGVIGVTYHMKLLEALRLAFRIYDNSGVGKVSCKNLIIILVHTLALSEYEAEDIFYRLDTAHLGYVTYESFVCYAEKKAEFANLFSLSKEEMKGRNGDLICPTESSKKYE